MDELEAKLYKVPYSLIEDYLNDASRLLQLQELQGPEVMITSRQKRIEASHERLIQAIKDEEIEASPQELSTYILRIATDIYRQHERSFLQQQSKMPALESINMDTAFPSVLSSIATHRYKLLVEKTLSGDFQL